MEGNRRAQTQTPKRKSGGSFLRGRQRSFTPDQLNHIEELFKNNYMVERRLGPGDPYPQEYSDIILLPKSNGTYRCVFDFVAANGVVQKVECKSMNPDVLVENLVKQLGSNGRITNFDLFNDGRITLFNIISAFNQLSFEDPENIFTVHVNGRFFKFLRFSQGMCDSPAVLHTNLERIFAGLINTSVFFHVDDCAIIAKEVNQTVDHLAKFLERCTDNNLYLNARNALFRE